MYSAAAVANAFLQLAKQENKSLTNMKLQKLVYIAHGWSLALLDMPLLSDEVRAWQWGPVIPSLYEQLKHYGSGVVTEPVAAFDEVPPNSQEMQVIRGVWRSYGKHDPFWQSAITHQKGTPWSETWSESHYSTIDPERIKRHYLYLKNVRTKSTSGAA